MREVRAISTPVEFIEAGERLMQEKMTAPTKPTPPEIVRILEGETRPRTRGEQEHAGADNWQWVVFIQAYVLGLVIGFLAGLFVAKEFSF